ncbi:Thioredoxin domain-containing protein 9 [Armadillidium nasatum]|uniref:Thioredoxin domain-containing protein 9 n=1 Tax=Armadillidium nasatum TaxID=96803 RepID=A0A5N5SKL7_9CRUS|nr:Thioredoxin domain-containing protein 9 [Armadillidium nasatum]KAB7498463.1 Thioredoxin domain-containing protein 9 [Armadillidium nasatum]
MAASGPPGVEQQLLVATKIIEQSIDAELERLENLDGDDLDSIRKQRMEALRKRALKKNEWIANGHGEYSELYDEKEFFEASKKSENIVCHFYRDSFLRCKILDKHMEILARKHIETKFCKINAEKAPFLTDRLKIRVLPTLCLLQKGKTRDFVVGFTDLGNIDDFSTEMLEWRIARAAVIEYSGDLLTPPTAGNTRGKQNIKLQKKTIRGGRDSDDTDSD